MEGKHRSEADDNRALSDCERRARDEFRVVHTRIDKSQLDTEPATQGGICRSRNESNAKVVFDELAVSDNSSPLSEIANYKMRPIATAREVGNCLSPPFGLAQERDFGFYHRHCLR
ncbi:MAG: hypothetical protein U0X73_08340 [Thermoanaerobaculia bacterium]